jgi:hypothetical protein
MEFVLIHVQLEAYQLMDIVKEDVILIFILIMENVTVYVHQIYH